MNFLLLTSFIILISGCASNSNWTKPAEDPGASMREAYQKCLVQHPKDKSVCDAYLGSHVNESTYFKGISEHPGEVYH